MAEYRINLEVDPTGARRASREVEQSLDRVSNRADRVRRLVTRAFAVVATAIGGREIIARIAGFEQAMSTVRAITQATESDFQRLQETARELGTNTRFSATEAAEGMQFLARAGFDTNEVLGAIEGTLQLAQAGALGLGSAADIASNVLTGFRLNTEETGRVVDVLAFAANNSNTNVQQLGDAMRFVAPVAAGLGVEIEEAAAAIGALSDAGLQGSLAGTGLRRVLSELASPANRTRRVLESLGLSAEDVAVQQVGLTEALRRLADAGVDTGVALELFGDRGGPAFEVLSNAIPRVAEMTQQLQNASGTAAEMARVMDDNLNGALLSVRSAWEGLILGFSDLGPGNALTVLVRGLAATLRLLAENIGVVTQSLAAFGVALAIPSIAAAGAGLRALAASFIAVASSATAATAAVARTVAALQLLLRALAIGFAIEGVQQLLELISRLRGVSEEAENVTRQLEAFDARQRQAAQGTGELNSALASVAGNTNEVVVATQRTTAALQGAAGAAGDYAQAQAAGAEASGAAAMAALEQSVALQRLAAVQSTVARSQNELVGASDRYIQALRELTRVEDSSAEAKLNLRARQIALIVALRTGQITLREYHMGMREVRQAYRELATGTQEAARAQADLVQGLDTVTAAAGRAEVAANRATSAIERLGSAASRGRIRGASGTLGSFDISDPDALRQALEAWLAGIPFASLNTGTSYVNGPAGIDRVPAMLTRGEAVITASANARHPGLAQRLNSGHQIQYFNTGTDYVRSTLTQSQTSNGYGATYRSTERRDQQQAVRGEEINNNQTVIINVTTPDADSFLRSREQIRRQEWTALRRAQQRAN